MLNDAGIAADTLPPPIPAADLPARHALEFHGKAGEYFGIWIVNVVFTILTLGIYSAWAKVRTQRYFYANTRLAGSSFEYLADPLRILKGRLIAYAFVIALAVSLQFQAFVVVVPLYLLLLASFPWLLNLGLRFRARYSAWRGLRFGFDGSVGGAYAVFMGLPLVALFTLNLLSPWVRKQQHQYMAGHHRFGGERFAFQADTGAYFVPFLIALLFGFGLVVALVGGLFALAAGATASGQSSAETAAAVSTWMLPLMTLFYGGFFALSIYLYTAYLNLMWRNTRLGEHRVESSLRARDLIWLFFSNGVVILCSLGLAVPWAMVRLARYRAAHFVLVANGSLDAFVAAAGNERSAASAELVDALDLDMDIGL